MTEAEWLTSDYAYSLWQLVIGGASERKSQLLAVALCRRAWPLLTDARSRSAVEVAERYADGDASEDERIAAYDAAKRVDGADVDERYARAIAQARIYANEVAERGEVSEGEQALARPAANSADADGVDVLAARAAAHAVGQRQAETSCDVVWEALLKNATTLEDVTVLADIVRDIFGNPFRPVALDPSLLTPTVTALAAQMYESRDFSAMPILADALQDEGCTSAAVLDHCRGPGPHVRGCWVVDQVLGKGHGRLMTEAEWLTGAEPRLMVKLLSGTVSDRKLRLFACAFYHRLSCVAGDSFADAAVEIAERFADGHATADELSGAATEVSAARDALDYSMANRPAHVALDLARDVTRPDAGQGAGDITRQCAFLCANGPFRTLGRLWWTADHRSVRNDMAAQMDLLRDIFGNPFRPVAFSPAWRTDTAVALASQMYESRDFRAMPVLADALQAAGCDNADVLDHCRAPGLHARGCWVVDLVLGKE